METSKIPMTVRKVWYEQYEKSKDGTKNPWYESSMVRNIHQWYETSKVRKVYGMKSPAFVYCMQCRARPLYQYR